MTAGKMLRTVFCIILALSMILSFTACKGAEKPGKSDSDTQKPATEEKKEEEQPKQTPAPEEEKAELTFLHYYTDTNRSAEAEAFRQAVKKYKDENPNITLTEDATADAIDQKIRILGSANELPDIYLSKYDTLSSFVQSGQAQPLDPFLDEDPEWKDNFLPGVLEEHVIDGKHYAIPIRQHINNVVYYNKGILKEAGYESFPATYEEFKKMVVAIKNKGYIPIILGNKDKWPGESCLFNTIAHKFTGADFVDRLLKGQAKFTDEPFIKAGQVVRELYDIGAFNKNVNSVNNDYAQAQFLDRKAAMYIEGSWAVGIVNRDDPKKVIAETDVAFFPEFDTGVQPGIIAFAVGWGNVLNAKVKEGPKLNAALKLLKALSSKEYGTTMAELGSNPVVKTNPIDESKLHPLAVNLKNNILAKYTPAPVYDVILPAPVSDALYTGFQELLIGVKTPQQYAEMVQKEMEPFQKK